MHECPKCGQACYCGGDIDDIQVFTEQWASVNCRHGCEEHDEDEDDYGLYPEEDDFDDFLGDDES